MNPQLARAELHRIVTVHAGGASSSQIEADCPRRRESVALEECAACPHLHRIGGEGPGNEHLMCVTERADDRIDAMPGTVRSFMTKDVWCVSEHVSFESLVALLRDRRIGALPVVDTAGHILGIVSLRDLVFATRNEPELDSFDVTLATRGGHKPALTAADVMTKDPLVLRENELIDRAARLLTQRRVHRAPVVSEDGRIVGMLTSSDVMRALAEPGPELED